MCLPMAIHRDLSLFCTDFAQVSRVLTFDAERTTDSVAIGILNDFEKEIVNETIDPQLSFVEEERGGGLVPGLVPGFEVETQEDAFIVHRMRKRLKSKSTCRSWSKLLSSLYYYVYSTTVARLVVYETYYYTNSV